jgi:hypothetical protein
MSDETEKTVGAEATPNRGRRRDAPTIEGQAIEEKAVESAPTTAEAAASASEPVRETTPDPAPARGSLAPALPGLAALLLAGVALYYALNPAIPQAPSPEAVAALGQRLDRAEARLGAVEAKPAPAMPAMPDLTPLTARIEAVEKAAEGARTTAGRALEQAQTPPKIPEAPKVDLTPLVSRIAKVEADLGPMRQALAAPKTDVRATEAPNVPGVGPQDAAALAVVAGSLRQQIDRGAPFVREVSALEKLGAEPTRLEKLKPLAATGAPSAARLAQDFGPVSSAMLRAARPARPDGDILDRLARSAASLVRIRPAGESAGEDAPALVSRIEGALQRGDVAEALALYDRLPAEVKEPGRDWATRARQRVDAEAAARGLLDEALDKLARK